MDVQDPASIRDCVQDVVQAHGKIDLLVNNAGSGYLATLEETSYAALASVMESTSSACGASPRPRSP